MQLYSFPAEVPTYFTRITFFEYSRPKPGSQAFRNAVATIRLPIPAGLTDSYGIMVNDTELEFLGNKPSEVVAAGKAKMDEYTNALRNGFVQNTITDIIVRGAALTPGISDTALGRRAQQEVGMVRNPHLTTIFDGVHLKSYTFTWKLAPKSQQEAYTVENIVQKIKEFMHPDLAAGGFALTYPYIATVEFDVGDAKILPNVKDSFITRMDINSSASGVPAFFRDGKPVTIELSIGFKEINVQTRRDVIPAGLTDR